MSTRSHGLDERLHEYIVTQCLRETELQARLRRVTAERFNADMQISPEQGQFFRFLVKAFGIRRAIEVGTFTGYSALAIASELPEGGHLDCCDVSEEYTAVAREFWEEAGVSHKIALHIAPGIETLQKLIASGQEGTYDFGFIDGDKEGYPEYYGLMMRLLRPGGIVCFDNTFWGGRVADPAEADTETEAIRELNRIAFSDPNVTASIVPISDGLTMVWKAPPR